MKRKLKSIAVRAVNGDEAWVYANARSIDIYIWQEGGPTLSARITEKKLKEITK